MKTIRIRFYSVLVLLSVYFLVQAYRFGYWKGFGPGPGLLPTILGILMLILSLYQLFSKKSLVCEDKGIFLEKNEKKRLLFLLLINIATVVLLESAGFIIAIFAFCFFIVVYMDKWQIGKGVLFSAGLSLVCWILFAIIFKLPLPEGVLSALL